MSSPDVDKVDDFLPHWAHEPWWHKHEMRGDHWPLDEIQKSVETVQQHFDIQWWNQVQLDRQRNAVFMQLLTRGLAPLSFIMALGTAINRLSSAEGCQRKISELKGNKSESALHELFVAARFACDGQPVWFPNETNKSKTPDIIADCGGHRLAIECKSLQREEWEIWRSVLSAQMSFGPIFQLRERGLKVCIELNPRITEIRMAEQTWPGINRVIANSILKWLEDTVNGLLASSHVMPIIRELPDVATIQIDNASEGDGSKIIIPEVSLAGKLRRILQNGFLEAVKQLPRDMPGIVVVGCEELPSPEYSQVVLNAITAADPATYGSVVGLLIDPQQYLGQRIPPLYIVNSSSRYAANDIERLNKFVESYNPKIV
jgi:Holliday junction resolvase